MKSPKNNVFKFKAKVGNFEITSKQLKSKYPKWKLFLAKKLGLDLKDNYSFLFRVQYHGSSKLLPDDLVVNEQGVYFVVLKEHNRLAMLATLDPLPVPPTLYGKIAVIKK